jgi:predicted PhzF superfamily epimerase YddE/YHI9
MMKKQPIYQVDAFTSNLFSGNPAAVCPLEAWLDDSVMQAIAQENNLSETAFIVPQGEQYQIRWFTPNQEVALCGHATLASAFVLFELLGFQSNEIIFNSQSGPLRVKKKGALLQMDFPVLPYHKITPQPELLAAMNVCPAEVFESTFDLLLIFDHESDVQQAKLDLDTIAKLQQRGVILSAPASSADIYSRCFYPGCDVHEDPVTGSAHCVIAPYWCERLGKTKIHAKQGGSRQGELWCEVTADRVLLSGRCQLYLEGRISIPE